MRSALRTFTRETALPRETVPFPKKHKAQPVFLSLNPPFLRRELQGCYFWPCSKGACPFQLSTKAGAKDFMKQDQWPQRGSSSLLGKQLVPGRATDEESGATSSIPLYPPGTRCVSLHTTHVNLSEPSILICKARMIMIIPTCRIVVKIQSHQIRKCI